MEGSIDDMSKEDLIRLRKKIDRAIDSHEHRRIDAAIRDIRGVAEEHGLSLAKIVEEIRRRNPKKIRPAKYRHPEDPSKTWSSLGRKPNWLLTQIKEGRTESDFLV